MTAIETTRLRLRPVQPADAALLPGLVTEKIGAMTASWPWPLTREAADRRVAETIAANADGGQFSRLIEHRADGAPMGWLGVTRRSADPQSGMLGYWLTDAFHGKGFLTEALQAFVPAAIAVLALQRLEAGARPDNAASIAALQRLGMRFHEQRLHYVPARACEEPTNFYRLTVVSSAFSPSR